MKSYLRQIKFEMRNIIRSKFLLILSILLIAAAVAFPVIDLIASKRNPYDGGVVRPMPIPGVIDIKREIIIDKPIWPGYPGGEPITVNGVTIEPSNPFYWQVQSIINEKGYMENDSQRFSTPEALDLALALLDEELDYYVNFARYITDSIDYRTDLAWRGQDSIYDIFIFKHADVQPEVLLEVINQRRGMDMEYLKNKYLNLSAEEKLAGLTKAEDELNNLYSIVETNNFPMYIDLRIAQENKSIEDLKKQIEQQEQEIIRNPDQEDIINETIMYLKRNIRQIEENTIPLLLLRKEKNIIPGQDTWQNRALNDIEMYRNQLTYTEIISEEQFNQQPWMVQQYGNYQNYVEIMQKQIDEMNKAIIIAEKSIYADKPDMKFVSNSTRNKTVSFLNYSVFVTLFAVLLGGWLMASEFQQGTIRLLMIRPKTRLKILSAKFISALIICLVVFAAGSLLNMITNGIVYGFADYAYPNYTIEGEIGFFAYYLPKMLACIVPIIFGYALAFMVSVLIKNVAVSIAIPIAGYIGNMILMATFSYRGIPKWLAYTPLPYLQLSTYFTTASTPYIIYDPMYTSGVTVNLTYGIILLLALSAVCIAVASIVFQKRDITN